MKKRTAIVTLTALAGMLAACPVLAEETAQDTQEAYDETYEEDDVYDEDVDYASDIDWDALLIDDADQYVTLGEYKGLDVEKYVYTISDEDIEIELDDRLYATAEVETVDRAAELGDTVIADITYTVDGETDTDEDYPIDLGYEVYGEDFDSQLIGLSAGESVSFTETFEDDFEDDEWAGQTVAFDVTVKEVQVLEQPDFTDKWVQENSDYDSADAYREALREELQAAADAESEESAASSAFSQAMANASFDGYPQSMYDAVYTQVYSQFEMLADLFGISMDELYESYELTDEDLQDEAAEEVNTYLFLSAVAKAEGLEITDEDLRSFSEETYADYGFDDADQMLEDSEPGELKLDALLHKVSHFILENAVVTETVYDYTEDDFIFDDSSAEDEAWDDEEYVEWDDEDWDEDDEDDDDWEEDDEDYDDEDDDDWDEDDEDE